MDDRPPFRTAEAERRLALRAARALRSNGITSLDELERTPRFDLLRLPGVGAHVFDYVNDALNRGDLARIEALFAADAP